MAYAQVHTQAIRHSKVLQLSNAAFRLWVHALCYAQEHRTDGFLDRAALPVLVTGIPRRPADPRPIVDELLRVGLWELVEGGWQLHDYPQWNATRATIEERLERNRERQRRWKDKQHADTSNALVTPSQRNETQRIDQNQDHPPAGGPARPKLKLHPKGPVNGKQLFVLVRDLAAEDPSQSDADLKEALKARAAQLGLTYDADTVRKVLDQWQERHTHTRRGA